MKFLTAVLILLSLSASAQQKILTIQEAMTPSAALLPENLRQLQFIKGTNDYAYLKKINGEDVYVRGSFASAEEAPFLTLSQFNQRLKNVKQDSLKTLPPLQFAADNYTVNIKGTKYSFSNSDQSYSTLISRSLGEKQNLEQSSAGWFSYLDNNNLFVQKDADKKQVTTDGSENIVYASSVHRDEFGISKGTFWSNKGDQLAFYRMDQSMVNDYPIIDWSVTPAKNTNIKYPMAGGKSHEVTIGLYNAVTKQTVWLKTEAGNFSEDVNAPAVLQNPKERYLTNIAWSPDDRFLYVAIVNRAQNHMWLNKYDAASGAYIRNVFEERDQKYIEPLVPMKFVPNKSGQFIWQSSRDGYNHLYLYDSAGKMIKPLTVGKWEVTEFKGFDEKGENIFYVSTESSPIGRDLYAVNLKTGKKTKLTGDTGFHITTLSSTNKYLIDSYSNGENFRTVQVTDIATGKSKRLLQAANPLQGYIPTARRLFTIKNKTGDDLWCRMYLPSDFDSLKKYPVIVYWYGGSHTQLVTNNWNLGSGDYWSQYMAQRGYIVFSMDTRGSDNRGKDFEQSVFREAGKPQMEDLKAGLSFLRSKGFADEKRMGLFGWSYGGFMTTNFVLNNPGIFKAAVAGGPVMDWQLYEIMYGERYMDTPQENPEGYAATNLINKAGKLKDKLMLIHGLQDPVVVQQNSVKFVKAAVDAGVQVDYMIYPGYEHNVTGKDRAHLYQKVSDYFELYLK